MDPETTLSTPLKPPKKSLPKKKLIILAGLILLSVILFGLNYFKIIKPQTASQPAPAPKKEVVFAKKILDSYPTSEADIKLQNGPFSCPLPSSFCKDKNNYKESSFSAQIGNNTKIKASFSGIAEGLKSFHPLPDGKDEEYQLVILTNNRLGLEAMYYFKGTAIAKKEVAEGEVIATSSGKPVNFIGNKSFVFSLMRNHREGGKLSALSPVDFK